MAEAITDSEGYLVDPADWSAPWASATARAEGLELTDQHWAVLRYMRAYYDEHAVPPDARFVIKYLTAQFAASRNRLFELFPYGYPGQACRFAGMRRPRIWSTG
jgi:dissimilatory sulfite reductase related protein